MISVKYFGCAHGKYFDCREELDRQNRDGVSHRDQGQHPSAAHRAISVFFQCKVGSS
jgi:hypothetical protein